MTSEQKACLKIDQLITLSKWEIKNIDRINLGISFRITVMEFPLDAGLTDYILFLDRLQV